MDKFKNRLVEFARMRYDMGQTRFEEKCGIHPGTISAIKSNGPTASVITKIAFTCPELNLNWLFRGEDGGPMLNGEHSKEEPSAPLSSPTNDIHNNIVFIGNWSELGSIVEKAVSKAMSNK